MVTLWAQPRAAALHRLGREVYQTATPIRRTIFEKINYFNELLHTLQRQRARLMKRQVAQEG